MKPNRVRLSAGRYKGVALEVPRGVRPTSSRVREALLDAWQFRLPEARVLDLFAGSGAVGLEALGRGADSLLALESDRRSVESLRRAFDDLGADGAEVRRARLPADLERFAAGERFDLIFADPPYGFADLGGLLEAAEELLAPDGEVIVEHSTRRPSPSRVGALERVDERRYGESQLSVYRR